MKDEEKEHKDEKRGSKEIPKKGSGKEKEKSKEIPKIESYETDNKGRRRFFIKCSEKLTKKIMKKLRKSLQNLISTIQNWLNFMHH